MKKILLVLILLSVFSVSGQNATNDSLTISLGMARLIEQDLIELDYLKIENNLQKSEIELLDKRLDLNVKKEQNLQQQLVLVQKQADNYNTLWQAEKKKKPSIWEKAKDIMIGVGIGALIMILK